MALAIIINLDSNVEFIEKIRFKSGSPDNPNVKAIGLQDLPTYSIKIGHLIGHLRYEICTDLARFGSVFKNIKP